MESPLLVLGVVMASLWVIGCQAEKTEAPPTVSLEEAKKITADIATRDSKPPPRSIGDVLKILREPEGDETSRLRRYRAVADAKPPNSTDADVLARFYLERGKAAEFLGRSSQTLADFELVRRYGRNADDTRAAVRRLGVSHVFKGEFKRALIYFEDNQNLAPDGSYGQISANSFLALVYAELGRIKDADAAIKRSQELFTEKYAAGSQTENVWQYLVGAWVKVAEGHALVARGEFSHAETMLREGIRDLNDNPQTRLNSDVIGSDDTPWEVWFKVKQWALAELALALRKQGRLLEAEVEIRRAIHDYVREFGRHSGRTVYALQVLAETIMDQSRFDEARLLTEESLSLYRRLGAAEDSYPIARARRIAAGTLTAEWRWSEASDAYLRLEKSLSERPQTRARILAEDLTWAVAYVRGGHAERAADSLRGLHAKRLDSLGGSHFDSAEAGGLLAGALAAQGKRIEAMRLFTAAIPILLDRVSLSTGSDSTASLRQVRLTFILQSYIRLLSKTGGAAEAFRIAEVARAQSVQRALNASGARAALRDPQLADLARREQDARQRIAALYGLLANNPKGQGSSDLRTRIERLKAAQTALAKELVSRFPAYADLIDPKPANVEDARAVLAPNEALITTLVGEDQTYIWAVNGKGKFALNVAPIGRLDLGHQVAMLRAALEPAASTIGDIPPFRVGAAHELYKLLLGPLEPVWQSADSLIVIPHGPLGALPFSLLPTKAVELGPETAPLFSRYRKVPWLARRHAVANVPSVAALRTLRGLPPAAPGREAFRGFGDPLFSAAPAAKAKKERNTDTNVNARRRVAQLRAAPKTRAADSADLSMLPRLPETADELRSIAIALKVDPQKHVYTGAAANEQQVKTMDLANTRVVAFATHGLLPGDLDGLLQPALALSAPKAANVPGDGLLTLDEILSLKLNADWVVLSACNTAAAEGAGAEAVSGLGRAFFYAGTRALLASNWPVETTSAKELTTTLFRQQSESPNLSRTHALQRAMLALIDGPGRSAGGKTFYSYAHPLFWAPFSIYGEGGARPTS